MTMTPLSYDLVIQGKDLSRSNLPADAAGLAGFIAEIAPGAVRLESVNPLTAEPVIGRLQEAGLDAAMVRHGLKLTEFRLLASDLDSTLVAIETLDTVAKNAGYGDTVAQVTEAAMRGDQGLRREPQTPDRSGEGVPREGVHRFRGNDALQPRRGTLGKELPRGGARVPHRDGWF